MMRCSYVGDVCQVCWIRIPMREQDRHAKYHDDFEECYKCQAFVPVYNRAIHDRYHIEMEARITKALIRAQAAETLVDQIRKEYPA